MTYGVFKSPVDSQIAVPGAFIWPSATSQSDFNANKKFGLMTYLEAAVLDRLQRQCKPPKSTWPRRSPLQSSHFWMPAPQTCGLE